MSKVKKAINCQPKGSLVNKDRVSKFSDDLKDGEKAHFITTTNWIKRGSEKINTARQDLVLFTDKRILILIRKTTASNDKNVINYDELSKISLKASIASKKIILTGENQEIVFRVARPNRTKCKDIVNFVENILNDEEIDKDLSNKSESVGRHSPIGSYVNKKRIKKVEDILDQDENVHYITKGSTIDVQGGSGESQFGNDRNRKKSLRGYIRAVFTQKRVVIKIPQWLGNDERTIPYQNISSIDLDTGLVNKRITLRASGGVYHIEAHNPGKSECREIVKFVRDKIRESQTSEDSSKSEDDPLDRLEKLKDLHDKGVVNDEEFEEKKQELMDKI